MDFPALPLLGSGFLIGWSVAWPPGPINAEIARRCLTGGFWAGFGLILGACAGDALWAVLVALGIGVLFTGPIMHKAMGILSVCLLLGLAIVFLRGAWRALRMRSSALAPPSRFDSNRASFLLGATMALTSPWNVAFWIAAVGRPELTLGTRLVGLGRAAPSGSQGQQPLVGCRRQGRNRPSDDVFRLHLGARAVRRIDGHSKDFNAFSAEVVAGSA